MRIVVDIIRVTLAAIAVVLFLRMVLITVIAWSSASMSGAPKWAFELVAVLAVMWVLWLAGIAWFIRSGLGVRKTPWRSQSDKTH